jgi:hypothetical protein
MLVAQLVILYTNECQILEYYMTLLHQKQLLIDTDKKDSDKLAAEEQTKVCMNVYIYIYLRMYVCICMY